MRQSGADTLGTEEPYEFIAHVRDGGGAGGVTTGSTRKRTAPSAGCGALRGVVAWGPPLTAGVRRFPRGNLDSRLFQSNRHGSRLYGIL